MNRPSFRSGTRLGIAAALLLSLAARGARGDDGAAAEALFEAGRAASRQGDVRVACERFRESYRLDPAPGTKLNLAVCEAELGHLAVAWRLLRALDQSLAPGDPRMKVVQEELAKLDGRVPRLTFEGIGALPPGVRVILDGAVITGSGFGVPIPVDPGNHVVEVRWPEGPPERQSFAVAEGERRAVPIGPPPKMASSQRPVSRERDAPRASSDHTWAIVALGTAGAMLAVGGAAGLGALKQKDTVDRLCDEGGCDPGGTRAARIGSTLATVSTITFVAGGVLAGVGVTLLLLGGPEERAPTASVSVFGTNVTLNARF